LKVQPSWNWTHLTWYLSLIERGREKSRNIDGGSLAMQRRPYGIAPMKHVWLSPWFHIPQSPERHELDATLKEQNDIAKPQ
jgi:hypothetical protein